MRALPCALATLLLAAACETAVSRPAPLALGPDTAPAAAQAAVRDAWPAGSAAEPLLAELRRRFADQPMTLVHDIVVDGRNLTGHAFRHVVARPHGNADHWVVRALVTADGRLRQTWVRRYFRDRDFAARGRRFDFADFERAGDAEAALRSLLAPEWNAGDVQAVMQGAGASAASGEAMTAIYDYREAADAPWPLPARWRTLWRFDNAGRASGLRIESLSR